MIYVNTSVRSCLIKSIIKYTQNNDRIITVLDKDYGYYVNSYQYGMNATVRLRNPVVLGSASLHSDLDKCHPLLASGGLVSRE